MLKMNFDGLYRGLSEDMRLEDSPSKTSQAGVMCYGWLIYRDGILVGRGHGGFIRRMETSSNIAEYIALIEGLEALADMGVRGEAIEILGDARSVIDQMVGRAQVNSPATRPLYQRALRLARGFPRLAWTWMPRKQNKAADLLTRRAIRQIRANPAAYRAAAEEARRKGQPRARRRGLTPLLDLRVFQPGGLPTPA